MIRADGKAEHPLPYTAAMMRAMCKGIKTQTRRLMRCQPLDVLPMKGEHDGKSWIILVERPSGDKPGTGSTIRCRYGNVGDFIWTRESYRAKPEHDGIPPRDIPQFSPIHFEATGGHFPTGQWGKLRPPMFMPRWMSRFDLQLVKIRAQRVSDISRADAIAEGVDEYAAGAMSPDSQRHMDPRDKFAYLWNSINPEHPFESNPWTWALTFPRQA